MTIKTWPTNERPREKLLSMGPKSLSDAELLAILIRSGIKNKNALDLARNLIKEMGGLRPLFNADIRTITKFPGIGNEKYAVFQACLELGQRYLAEAMKKRQVLRGAKNTERYLMARMRDYQHEVFACLFLDTHNRVISFDELFHGTVNETSVHPREVVKRALKHNAVSVILAHNHPSGISKPSKIDEMITEQLKAALKLIDVEVLDHVVVGDAKCDSM